MIKNIMSAVLAVSVAFGAGTSMTTQATMKNKSEKTIKVASSTTLSDHYSKVEFVHSKDIKKIVSYYKLKKVNNISKIIYIPIKDYSVSDTEGDQNNIVSVETRLASYSLKKQGFQDKVSFCGSLKTSEKKISLNKRVSCSNNFSDIRSVVGGKSTLDSSMKLAYGVSSMKSFKVKDDLKLSDKNSSNVSIYTLERGYDYQLWESDLAHDVPSDSYLGSGTIKRPLGLIVVIK